MATITNLNAIFTNLCSNADFIEVYNEYTGQNVTKLTVAQLFSTGSLYHIVNIKFPDGSGELRLTDSYFDITYQSKLYIASGDFLDIQNNEETKEIANKGMSIRVSNVRPEYIQLIQNKKFDKADVIIQMVFMNPQTGQVEAAFGVFNGTIDSSTITLNYSKPEVTNQTDVKINSLWAVLDKKARNHCADGVHRSYPGNENDGFFSKIGAWNSEAIWSTKK